MKSAQQFLKKIPQYTRLGRHARSVIDHGTPRKFANLARVEMERRLRRIEVRSRPYILILDPCSFCNLRCPLCPTGMNALGRKQAVMSFDCFKRYFEPHSPYLFEVNLYNWGESMINKDVYKMVAYAQSKNVGTNLSSNLTIAKSDDLDNLIESGLEYLSVSLDGVDQDSYEPYRIRGNFARVVDNMADLIRRRNARGKKTPFVEWQYIVMKHNEAKVDAAQELADRVGVDLLRFIPPGLPFESENRQPLAEKYFPNSLEARSEGDSVPQTFGMNDRPSPCFYLYRSMIINADGGVSPCCIVYKDTHDFDDMGAHEEIDISKIWNNDKYRSARALYSPDVAPQTVETVCDKCDLFARHHSKQ